MQSYRVTDLGNLERQLKRALKILSIFIFSVLGVALITLIVSLILS